MPPRAPEPDHHPAEPRARAGRDGGARCREDYAQRHPGPEDVFSVIEVAESSLLRDRTHKLRIYAGAGVPQYVVIDLVHDRVEVFEDPDLTEARYRRVATLAKGDVLTLRAGADDGRLDLAVEALLG